MKKPKLTLGPGGIKGLLARHIEKMVFVFAMLLVVAFFVLGLGLKSDLGDKTPPMLKDLAARAVSHVQESTAEAIAAGIVG